MSARSLNKVLLIGNLTRDPELRYTPNGTAVCTFGLATNRSWVPSDGSETQEETEYHRIVSWSKLAEICGKLLFKGRKVYVEGRLQTRKWAGQDGVERVTTEVVIDNMIALSPPKNGYQSEEYADLDELGGYETTPIGDTAAATPVVAPETTNAQPETTVVEEKSKKPVKQEVNVDDIPF